jgi:hypothetical protein
MENIMEDKTMDILEKYLDKDFRISPMSQKKYTINDIMEIEKELEIKFSEEYIAHLLADVAEVLGERGLYIEVKETIWKRPELYDVGPFWTFLYGIHTFTPSKVDEYAGWMRLDVVGKEFIKETGIKAVPILKIIGDADLYCVNENGKIVQYNHEESILNEIKMDFWELFEKELKELKERKEETIKENNKNKNNGGTPALHITGLFTLRLFLFRQAAYVLSANTSLVSLLMAVYTIRYGN